MKKLQKRVDVFLDMLRLGEIDKVSVDADQADLLLHLLDAVVIKLEGGTEEDLKVLDAKPLNPPIPKEIPPISKEKNQTKDQKSEQEAEKQSEKVYVWNNIIKINY